LIAPLASVTLFYYVSRLVQVEAVGSSDGYFAYVVVGIVALDVLASTLGYTPATIRQELVAGTFERVVLSPFGAVRSIVAMLAFPLTQSLIVGAATLGFAAVTFGMPIAWPSILLSPPAALLGALAFAPLGLLVVAGMLVIKQTIAAASLAITVMSICAGAYFPISLLPASIRWVSDVQPLTPALDLLRNLVSSTPIESSPWVAASKLVGFTLLLFPPSLWCVQRALTHSRTRGTITEY
jgi:ABC-2 type transport system permease protein